MIGGFFRKRARLDELSLNTDLLIKAWQLSMVLLDLDSILACKVVLDAIELADTYHPKLPYSPLRSRRHRNKLIFDKDMLFQYFIYEVTKRYEIAQEQEYLDGKRFLHEQTMIIRYIKHLLLESTENRSFSVTVGLCRLLYNYKQSHTSTIYESLTQYGGPDKSDDQYRECKLRLMDRLENRFHNFLVISKGPKQEKRFQPYENQSRIADYVKQCLHFFTPWKSSCILPTALAGAHPLITHLSFVGSNPDDEHPIEKARIHTLIHPTCFSQLIEALGYSSPDERLAMPHLISNDHNAPLIDLNNPPVPTNEELNNLIDGVLKQRYRRQHSSSKELAIVIDGIQRECLALEKTSSAQIELEKGDNLIQIFSKEKDGSILLSTLSLTLNNILWNDKPWKSCLKLEGGQKISIAVLTNEVGNIDCILAPKVEITYRETNLFRASSLLLRKLRYEISQRAVWMKAFIKNFYQNKLTDKIEIVRLIAKESIFSRNNFHIERSFLILILVLFIFGAIKATITFRAVEAENKQFKQINNEYARNSKRQNERILDLNEQARQASEEILRLRQERDELEDIKQKNKQLQIRLSTIEDRSKEQARQTSRESPSQIAELKQEILRLRHKLDEPDEIKVENRGRGQNYDRTYGNP